MEERSENSANPQRAACWACGSEIGAQDRYCRHCGKGQGEHIPWYYRHWGIILMTLFGLGPFGLILVWRSPLLSREARAAYTAAIVLITWFVINRLISVWAFFQAAMGGMTGY